MTTMLDLPATPTTPVLHSPERRLEELTAQALRELVESHGYDATVVLLYDTLCRTEPHAGFIRQIETSPVDPRRLAEKNFSLAVVPGALYKEYPRTGADGRRFVDMVRTLGIPIHFIPTKSLGTLAENAAIINAWLAARAGENLILISFSKGSADVKTALQSPGAQTGFQRVAAWLSVGGILHGTPLISWLRRQRLRYFLVRLILRFRYRAAPRILEELDHGPQFPLDAPLVLPPHLRLVHLIALPTRADLSIPLAHRAFRRLLPLGPNDAGGLLLADLARFPGTIYPLRHADHYLRNCPQLSQLLMKLLACAIPSHDVLC